MTVIFTKAGLFHEKWSGKLQKNVRRRVKKLSVWTHLRDACEIEEGVTLLDIFRTVAQYKALRVFMAQYSWCKALDDFHAQAEEPEFEEEDPNEKMTHLEVYWHCSYNEGKKGERWVEVSPSFHGIGKAMGEYAAHSVDGLMQWAIDFSPMQRLADLPVKLNEEVAFYQPKDYKQDRKPIMEGERCFSLQEVLDAIYWEISFHGAPHSKAEKLDELRTTVEGIKNGTIETFPMDLDDQKETD